MKEYRCTLCNYHISMIPHNHEYNRKARHRMGEHYDTVHKDQLPEGMDGYRYFYYLMTGKDKGSCIECHKPTDFNYTTMKYSRFCNNPECKQKYRKVRDERVMGKYGKLYMTTDPEFQRKMLAGRRISGIYRWSDGSAQFPYVGSYEKDFLRMLDEELHWPSSDLMMPSPNTYYYDFDGDSRFYIPDALIPSLNLEVEIKDDGSAKRINADSRAKDIRILEFMKTLKNVNYIKIVNKNYDEFMKIVNKEGDKESG